MLKLDDIAEKVYFDFRKAQIEGMATERLGHIHVSDLITIDSNYKRKHFRFSPFLSKLIITCLLYTSDAADE